jgi:hypothetical protein
MSEDRGPKTEDRRAKGEILAARRAQRRTHDDPKLTMITKKKHNLFIVLFEASWSSCKAVGRYGE